MTHQSSIDPKAFKQFERTRFSQIAAAYDQTVAQVTSQVDEALLDAVRATHRTRLLDVACGPGWLSAAAVRRQAKVTGLDSAQQMVVIARSRCPVAEIYQGDAETLPFEMSRFEAVVCNLGFPHFPAPERAIAEAFRVLKPGGRYAFTCWRPPERNPFMQLILGSVQIHGTMELDLPPGPPLFRFGDPAECEQALSTGGFSSVFVTELPLVWHFAKPEDVVPGVVASTARLGPMLAMQTEAQRHQIEQAIIEGAKQYATDRGIEIPAAVVQAIAYKP